MASARDATAGRPRVSPRAYEAGGAVKRVKTLQTAWRVAGMVRDVLKRGELTQADRDAFFKDKGVAEILRRKPRRKKRPTKKRA